MGRHQVFAQSLFEPISPRPSELDGRRLIRLRILFHGRSWKRITNLYNASWEPSFKTVVGAGLQMSIKRP